MMFNINIENEEQKDVATCLIYAFLRKYFHTSSVGGGSSDECAEDGRLEHGSSYSHADYWISIDETRVDPNAISKMLDCLPVTYVVTEK